MLKNILLLGFSLLLNSAYAQDTLLMSTTTSTENSGLMQVLNPVFTKRYNVNLDVIAVGTGKALRLAVNGDVDVVFVHAPTAELKFVTAGYGTDRQAVMHNDFVLIGPKSNPAAIEINQSITSALQQIARAQVPFISRGDDSGTHKKELALWRQAKITTAEPWYLEVGQSMGAVINIADEKQAYTLTDRGTYLAFKDKIDLIIVNEGDNALFNPYHIIAVNPARHKHVNYELAKKYIAFITGTEGQALIGAYQKHGEQLFYPDAR
nr:substrate-binding domain-containing protein [Bathymodiolus japonicus methanotrophic gill symbiont]